MGEQCQAAMQAMSNWLADDHELGAPPYKIEPAGDFMLNDMRYYIFRYKKGPLGRWLLGVCGGYEGDSLAHCGHVFSEMEPYDPATAQEQATAMVEMMCQYWKDQVQRSELLEEAGLFLGFVLLEKTSWDPSSLWQSLAKWGVARPQQVDEKESQLVWEIDGMFVAVSLTPFPIPDGEAEESAQSNYLWPDAPAAARAHQAHMDVVVVPRGCPPEEAGRLHVKLCAAALQQSGALGIYINGTVLQPQFYLDMAKPLKEGELPLYNLVFVGLRSNENGVSGYTCGLNQFGLREMEVLDSAASSEEVVDLLYSIAKYVMENGVILHDGETIGMSAKQKLSITLSPGVSVEGDSLKIGF